MGLKVQIRIERDKSHFVKKSFDGIDAAMAFLDSVKREKTKRQLKEWLWFEELSDFENGGKPKNVKNLSLTCNTTEETVLALRQTASKYGKGAWQYKHFMSAADYLQRLCEDVKRKSGNIGTDLSVGKKN